MKVAFANLATLYETTTQKISTIKFSFPSGNILMNVVSGRPSLLFVGY